MSSPIVLFAPKERVFRIPQANEVERIGTLIELVGLGARTSRDIARKMEFKPRQSSYYREAGEVLGFLNSRRPYTLTDLGREFLVSSSEKRIKLMVWALLRNPMIVEIMSALRARIVLSVSIGDIEGLVGSVGRLKRTTVRRRAHTILAWLRWLHSHYGIISVNRNVVRLANHQVMLADTLVGESRPRA